MRIACALALALALSACANGPTAISDVIDMHRAAKPLPKPEKAP